MDYKALLIKYKYSYGESYKEKMINFLTEVMGDDVAQEYWMDLHNYDRIGKFLEESKVETFEEQIKFLEDNKYKFDGYVKSCEDLEAKNYPEVPEFIKERLEFMVNYSHLMLMVRINCILEILKEFGIEPKDKEIIDHYIVFNLLNYDDKIYREIHGGEYREILSNKEYHDNIVNNLKKAGLHNIEA